MTSPLSQDKAKAVLTYALQLSDHGFWGFLNEKHLDARPGLSAALDRQLKFATTNTIAAICRNCGVTLEELCHSGLLKVRLVNDQTTPMPLEQQKECVDSMNQSLQSLILGAPIADRHGHPLSIENYAGDVIAPVVSVRPSGTNIDSDAAQADLEHFETNDSLYLDMSALKALAEGRATDAPQKAAARGR